MRIFGRAIVAALLWQLALASAEPAHADQQTPAGIDQATSSAANDGSQAPIRERSTKPKKVKKAKKATHPSFSIGQLDVELTARIEGDARAATPTIGLDTGQLDWQDRRVGVRGTVAKRLEFEFSRELGQDFETARGFSTKTPWRDVYVNARLARAFNVEAGQFKIPFGHEELIGETNLDFPFRALASRVLAPGRDPGVMAHGDFFRRAVEYQIGYFSRDGMNGRTSAIEGGRDAIAARLVVAPFAALSSGLSSLHLGIAAADSRLDNQLGIRGRTVLADGVFFDRLYVNGHRRRTGVEASWVGGPVGVSSEYITLSEERKGMGFDAADLPPVEARGWYVAGTYALTGEHKRGRLEPTRDLFVEGIGAIEFAARWEVLRFADTSYPTSAFGYPRADVLLGNADRVLTLGVNWYLNRYAKWQADLIRESIEDAARSPAPGSGTFTTMILRLQLRL